MLQVRRICFHAVKKLSFKQEEGELLGVVGNEGSGKRSLLKALAGIFTSDVDFVETPSILACYDEFVSK